VGLTVALLAVIYTAVILLQTLAFGRDVPGYASLMIVMLILGAVQIVSLGVLGEYIGRLYMETKQRPIYLVQEIVGLDRPVRSECAVPSLVDLPQDIGRASHDNDRA